MIQHINKQSAVTPFVHFTETLNTPLSVSQITICSVYLIFQINLLSHLASKSVGTVSPSPGYTGKDVILTIRFHCQYVEQYVHYRKTFHNV